MDNQQRNFENDKNRIVEMYLNGTSANKLSKMYNKNISSIVWLLRSKNVTIRSVKESVNMQLNSENSKRENLTVTNKFYQKLIGLLCGDGSLRKTIKSKYCIYTHTDKHLDYIENLKREFESQGIKVSKIWKNKTSGCYAFQTQSLKMYDDLYRLFYGDSSKKKVLNIILTPTILYNWYVGDGSVKSSKDSKNVATEISCKWYCPYIEKQLQNRFGKGCKYHHSSLKYYIPVKYRNAFLDYIGECKESCYLYKFVRNSEDVQRL